MSQNNNIPFVNKISSDILNNSNNGWANFDTFENNTNQNLESTSVIVSNLEDDDDDWADFQSNTEHSIEELSNDKQSDKINDDFGEVQISPTSLLSINSLNTDQLISTCFPLESSLLSSDNMNNLIPFELPTFTTFKDEMKQLPCFKPSLCLWNGLSNIPNDPLGIQYQWRKSNTERLFHKALGVHGRLQPKIIPAVSTTNSNVDNENKNVDSDFDWKENSFIDVNNLSFPTNSCDIDDNLFDVDNDIPPISISTSNREESIISSSIIHRTNSPIIQQQSTPIKTMDLFPGSTTVLNDDSKPVVNTIPNFSFMNPKALMSSTQMTRESAI